MYVKKMVLFLIGLSVLSLCIGTGVVAYQWGYLQSIIDNGIPVFSAPASVSIISGIPFFMATILFTFIAILINKK